MSITRSIRDAIAAELGSVVGYPATDARSIENDGFEPTPDVSWSEERLVPGVRRLRSLSARRGRVLVPGSYKILLHVPLADGTAAVDDLVDAIIEQFPHGHTITVGGNDVIIGYPNSDGGASRSSGGRDFEENWYTVPVEIPWHYYTRNSLT